MIPGLDAPLFAQDKKALEYTVPVSYEPKVWYSNSNVGNLHTVLGLVHLFLLTGISFAFPLLPVPPHPTIKEAPSPLAALTELPTAATPFV